MVNVKQGEILKLNLDPTKGHEQAGYRLVLVVSNNSFNKMCGGLIMVAPITSEIKKFPLNIELPKGLQTYGQVLLSQVRTIDIGKRGFRKVERVSDTFLEEIISLITMIVKQEN